MIKGQLNNSDFFFMDGDITCKDDSTRKLIRALFDNIMIGFKPEDGEPELYLMEILKKSGAKDLEYIPDEDAENRIY